MFRKNLEKIEQLIDDNNVNQKLTDITQELTREELATSGLKAQKSSAIMPLFLLKEFSITKIMSYLSLLIFGALTIYSIIEINKIWGSYFKMVLPLIIIVFSLYKVAESLLNLSGVFNDIKAIKLDEKNAFKTIPHFIVKLLRKLYLKLIDVNWISGAFYIIGGLMVFSLKFLEGKKIPFTDIVINFGQYDIQYSYFWFLKWGLLVVLVWHIFYIIWVKKRINDITNFYGYEIIPHQEIIALQKARNGFWTKVALIIFAIIFVVFIVFYKGIRKLIKK